MPYPDSSEARVPPASLILFALAPPQFPCSPSLVVGILASPRGRAWLVTVPGLSLGAELEKRGGEPWASVLLELYLQVVDVNFLGRGSLVLPTTPSLILSLDRLSCAVFLGLPAWRPANPGYEWARRVQGPFCSGDE